MTTATNGNRSRLREERVAVVGGFPWFTQAFAKGLRSLPIPTDDLQQDFGPDIYRKMRRDPVVSGSLRTLVLSALAQGIYLTAAVPKPNRREKDAAVLARWQKASEMAEFNRHNLETINPHFLDVACDVLMESLSVGHRKAELVYREPFPSELEPFPGVSRALMLGRIKPKQQSALSFVTDEALNVVGFTRTSVAKTQALTEAQRREVLPRDKFLVYSWMPQDSDPRGTSLLRSAYVFWWLKIQLIGEYQKFCAQRVVPSTAALLKDEAQDSTRYDPDTDTTVVRRVLDDVKAAMEGLQNGSFAVLSGVEELKVLTSQQDDGGAFQRAFSYCDQQIEYAISGQTLAGSEAQFGTRAQAETHANTRDLLTNYIRQTFAAAIRDDVCLPLTILNYGEAARALVPTVSLCRTGPEDIPLLLTALGKIGFKLHVSQFDALDAEAALPERDENWQESMPQDQPPGMDPNADPADDPDAEDAADQAQEQP